MNPQTRIILHLDMDYFFAAVEERKRPELKGRPVIVGADPKEGAGRGVVSTCNYEARKFGSRSGMPISTAWRLCPQAVYLPVDFPAYIEASADIVTIVRKYAQKVEQVSIDEAYVDVSDLADYENARRLAYQLKEEIREKQKLPCSIGIGPNKLVAKIATELGKPNGLTVLRSEEIPQKMWPLDVGKLPGIGPKTAPLLGQMGITTIGDLARTDPAALQDAFGKAGYELHQLARGIDERLVEEQREPKSLSRETTFETDVSDAEMIRRVLEELSHDVHTTALNAGYFYKIVSIKIRFTDFETYTRSRTIKHTTNSATIEKTTQDLVQPFLNQRQPIRLIGVRVSGLVPTAGWTSVTDFAATGKRGQ